MCVCVCVCVRACVRACVHMSMSDDVYSVHVLVCVHICMCVHIYCTCGMLQTLTSSASRWHGIIESQFSTSLAS